MSKANKIKKMAAKSIGQKLGDRDRKNIFKHYSKMGAGELNKNEKQIHDTEKRHGIPANKNHLKSIAYHKSAVMAGKTKHEAIKRVKNLEHLRDKKTHERF